MQLSCEEFIAALSSKAPTPGGGGGAALVGAAGMALANMVGNLTVGKKKYAEVQQEIESLLANGERLQWELLALAEADAKVFEPLAAAYALPGQTPREQEYKAAKLSEHCLAAAAVPMQLMEHCLTGLQITRRVAEIGSKLAISDAGCAAYFLAAAAGAARLNVLINLPLIQDEDYTAAARETVDRLLADTARLCEETVAIVAGRL